MNAYIPAHGTAADRPVDGVEQRREHRLEDRRDGVDQPVDDVECDAAAERSVPGGAW